MFIPGPPALRRRLFIRIYRWEIKLRYSLVELRESVSKFVAARWREIAAVFFLLMLASAALYLCWFIGLAFCLELFSLAWKSSLNSMGTTTLALAGASIYPLSDLWVEFKHHRWLGVKQHWGERLKYGFLIALMWWGALFSYHLYKVRNEIYLQAESETIQAPKSKLPSAPTLAGC